MNTKQGAALVLIVLLVVVALVAGADFLSAPSTNVTYAVPPSAVRASLGKTASDGTIALRLNSISDASNPATASAWAEFNNGDYSTGVYYFSLTPPPASRYLVGNVTVTNVHHTEIPFDFGDFVLIARDGTAYYANYAVCNTGCSAQALKNSALNETFSSDVYVLFSVPSATQPVQIVFYGANPPIAMSST
ncbi:MAG: hypothetical protein ABSD89_11490 [Halobacteriota archaeon]|jgi:hypothetical protein